MCGLQYSFEMIEIPNVTAVPVVVPELYMTVLGRVPFEVIRCVLLFQNLVHFLDCPPVILS